jgi:ribonuclease-3
MEIPQGISKVESPRELARRLNLQFPNDQLLHRALTHRSYINEYQGDLNDNERLEFLGDAVLDFLVGVWLYQRFPEMSEGQLTRMRSALVRTEQLAAFASQIDLGAALLLGRGESDSGGRQRPALLCAVFEALVGAIYLDIGLPAVREFVEPFLESVAD